MERSCKIKDMYTSGKTIKEIAEELKTTNTYVSESLQLDGIEIRGKSSTSIDWDSYYDTILPLYEEGKSLRQIEKELGIDRKKISFLLKKRNHEISAAKYKYHKNCFDEINTEEKAYWLGMMYADGYISKKTNECSLSLHNQDLELLRKFADFAGTDLPIYSQWTTNNKRVVISNKEIKEGLIKNGCIPAKTFVIKFPSKDILPDELVNHFIRGYMDGGLYVETHGNGKTKSILLYITGNKMFIESMKNHLGLVDSVLIKESEKDTYTLRVKGNKKPMDILETIYREATIYMKRKYDIYQSYKNLPSG